jgi:Tol biopolymer transport system component
MSVLCDQAIPRKHTLKSWVIRAVPVTVAALVSVFVAACFGSDGTGGQAVYSSNEDGLPGVYLIDTESGDVTRLTSSAGYDSGPVWSPDRSLIAFISDRTGSPTLWVMSADGTSEEPPFPGVEPVTDFRWAPDSTRLAILVGEASGGRILVGDLETGETEPLTLDGEFALLGDWSPDGDWVVYSLSHEDRMGLYKRNPRGVQEIQITSGQDTNPVWSPKGGLIAFSRPVDDGSLDINVVSPDGEDGRVLYHTNGTETSIEWSPDGRRLVFVSDQDGNREIYLMDADGEDEPIRLTKNRVADDLPRWSKDGKYILFTSDNDGDFDLYTMYRDGTGQRRITSNDSDDIQFDW